MRSAMETDLTLETRNPAAIVRMPPQAEFFQIKQMPDVETRQDRKNHSCHTGRFYNGIDSDSNGAKAK